MIADRLPPQSNPGADSRAPGIARLAPPLPLFLLQPLLNHIVTKVAARHPELFARLGTSCNKRYKIESSSMPFFLLLRPNPANPRLTAYNRGAAVDHDVYISGTFATLLRMIDNQVDSDALFFNRELIITGDAEASVALRNALDNLDASLADDVADTLGPFGPPVRAIMDRITRVAESRS